MPPQTFPHFGKLILRPGYNNRKYGEILQKKVFPTIIFLKQKLREERYVKQGLPLS